MEHVEDEEPKAYLVAHVREALARDGRTNELHVDVTVAGRRIFLTGEVATGERRAAVADVVREVAPGYEVHNETDVPAVDAPAEPEELG
jgi:osmotically-inducible protein OsmY